MQVENISNSYPVTSTLSESHQEIIIPVEHFELSKDLSIQFKIKRFIDIVASAGVLVFFTPIWILMGILIKVDSEGPVFYKQRRIGRHGKPFAMYKFRTMFNNAEKQTGPVWAKRDDARVTKMGGFLRKFGIDEIPNLINVFLGDMSLIGPRPERPYFVNQFRHKIKNYTSRLELKPGISGLAQIYYKYDESIEDVKKKLEYDLTYIENFSLWLDIKIVFLTFYIILAGKSKF